MAGNTAVAASPGTIPGPGGRPGAIALSVLRPVLRFAGVVPFTVYVLAGLLAPTVAVAVGAFQDSVTGKFTLSNARIATHGIYLEGFRQSIELSLLSAIIPGVLGLLVAYAIHTARRASVLRRIAITASGVFANFGGVPLAFLFIATLGSTGLAVNWLKALGFDPYDHGFSLYTFIGIAIVYLYFQIPLMVLVITPALERLRPAWREAGDHLGASSWQYWRRVG